MYNFLEEDHKFKVICTDDHKHVLLVGGVTDGDMIREYANKHNMSIIGEDGVEANLGSLYYIVYENPDKERFMLAIGALIRRLAPFKPFDYMYEWFYRTNRNQLVTYGYYLCTKGAGPCPFEQYDEKKHGKLTKMELPHA